MVATPQQELLDIADRLGRVSKAGEEETIDSPLRALESAAKKVGKAWSGSWLGYQSLVYYEGFQPPPAGAQFSQEWGFKELHSIPTTTGNWQEYAFDDVKAEIAELAGGPDLLAVRMASQEAAEAFDTEKSAVLSIIITECDSRPDAFLQGLKNEAEKVAVHSPRDFQRSWQPAGQILTRDMIALGQGSQIPPHLSVLAEVAALRSPFVACITVGKLARKAGSHLSRRRRLGQKAELIGTNVFIGHGRSQVWRVLKDFVQDRLGLPWDEFNRVPVAGITNIARLSEMLDAAAIAFLLMTGEDEQADGRLHARMNVVHEAGLFQGRLGFTRAIVVLEDGCEAFSNIEGLGQIRFPKGNIQAAFEEIRQVLEREGLLAGEDAAVERPE